MQTKRLYRHGNTVRLTLGRSTMELLKAKPGDTVVIEHIAQGVIRITHADTWQRNHPDELAAA
jgi:hypothetical protein